MRYFLAIILVVVVSVVLLYLSMFWPFEFWARRSFLGEMGLRPGGDMIGFWLRGTPFAQFDLLIWIVGSFLSLTVTEKLVQKLVKG